MHYKIDSIKIKDLILLIDTKRIDLSPSYQREFIWNLTDQKDLIKTIQKQYPLPSIFIRILKDDKFEMVDGQQRSRSIYRFFRDEIKILEKDNISEINADFLEYDIPVVFISNATDEQTRECYMLINKKGKFLNTAEVQKSEFSETRFLKLAEELNNDQSFINLNLFSNITTLRLNDRDFVQELLGYLLMYYRDINNNENIGYEGIRDKKKYIELEIFLKDNDISEEELSFVRERFFEIIQKIRSFEELKQISTTRYRQKNDFFTLFNFLNKHYYIDTDILPEFYKVLLLLDKKDKNGNQIIRPTNEECDALRNYALNCVSQSNSKTARIARLNFFEDVLLNKYSSFQSIQEFNPQFFDVLAFYAETFHEANVTLQKIRDYHLLRTTDIS